MNQIVIGYIPKDWKPDDNADNPGHIAVGDDSSGTIHNVVEYENVHDDDDNPEILVNGKLRLSLDDGHFPDTFKRIADDFFGEIRERDGNLDIASALRAGWYILDDDWIEDEMLPRYGLEEIVPIDADGGEFENRDGRFNGCMYLALRNAEQVEDGEDGNLFILRPKS